MRYFKIFFSGICILILQLSSNLPANSLDVSTLTFYWQDSESTNLNRTFYEDQVKPGRSRGAFVEIQTQDSNYVNEYIYLQKYVNGTWNQVAIQTLKVSTESRLEPLTASYFIDPLCGKIQWCSGKYQYRFTLRNIILKEFAVNFVSNKSNLKLKLSTDREQAWGTVHLLKASVAPKVSVRCTVERDGENIGDFQVKSGLGSMKFRALANEKPDSGRTTVTLYAVCKAGKYLGESDVGFVLFVP